MPVASVDLKNRSPVIKLLLLSWEIQLSLPYVSGAEEADGLSLSETWLRVLQCEAAAVTNERWHTGNLTRGCSCVRFADGRRTAR